MKSIIGIICASIITVLLFCLFDFCLIKLIEWVVDWQLLWFVITFFIADFVLIYTAKFLSALVAFPIRFSETKKQLSVTKWVLYALTWGCALLNFGLIIYYVNFSVEREIITGLMAVFVNFSLLFMINRNVKFRIIASETGISYYCVMLSMEIVKAIKKGKITYQEMINQVLSMEKEYGSNLLPGFLVETAREIANAIVDGGITYNVAVNNVLSMNDTFNEVQTMLLLTMIKEEPKVAAIRMMAHDVKERMERQKK